MSGYATARQLVESQSDTAEEPLGASQPLRPWRAVMALCATVLLVGAACSVAAGASEGPSGTRPTAPRTRSVAALDFVSKEAEEGEKNCHIQPAGSGFSVEDATNCAKSLIASLSGNTSNETDAVGMDSYNQSDHEITVSFKVKSTADIDSAQVEAQYQAIQAAAMSVLGASGMIALPHELSRSCMHAFPSTDELRVNCLFTLYGEDDTKALWEKCMSASDSEGSIAGELGVLEGPTVTDVTCMKNAFSW
mmetsp:Transcript_64725/g.168339  ORF Transcript_64725/g.168339 Transcript_64725/m.168339 type:complete len:250 (-) Transcript_64725:130-879(-)